MAGAVCCWAGLRMIWNPLWSIAQLPINHDSRSDRQIVLVVLRRDWRRRMKFEIGLMSRRILSRLRSVGEDVSLSSICSSSLLIMLEEKESDDFFLLQWCSLGASLIQVGWGCCKDFLCRVFVDRNAGVDGPKADDKPATDSKTRMLVYELWRAIMLESYEIIGAEQSKQWWCAYLWLWVMRTKNFLQARWLEVALMSQGCVSFSTAEMLCSASASSTRMKWSIYTYSIVDVNYSNSPEHPAILLLIR